MALIDRLALCRQMLLLGSRPVVAAHVSGVSAGMAIRLYRLIYGRPAPRGMLPCSADWYCRGRDNRLEASRFAAIHARLRHHARLDRAQALIAAWKTYAGRRQAPRLSIDRAWFLLRLMDAGEILLARCGRCGALQALLRFEPTPVCGCDLCRGAK